MTPAPRRMPLQPYSPNVPVFSGMNGCQFAVSMKSAPAPMTTSTMPTLMTTMIAFTVADSLTPTMSRAVTATVISTAGRLKTAVAVPPPASCTIVPGAELMQQRDETAGPADRDRRRAERVLEDQVPADDPGDELAERRVGVGIGGTGDRHGGGKFGIAQRGQHAGQSGQD